MMADLIEVVLPLPAVPRPGAQHVGQRQAGAEGADLEKAAATDAVAVTLRRSPKCEHLRHPPNWFRNCLPVDRERTKARLVMLPARPKTSKWILIKNAH